MSWTRAGKHFLIHTETKDAVIIIDILHSRSDLPGKIAGLSEVRGRDPWDGKDRTH